MSNKEIAVRPVNEFALFQNVNMNITQLMKDNLQDEDFGPQDLDRIKVPAGGGQSFEIPTLEGTEDVKEIQAMVVAIKKGRSYWKEELTGEGTPPNCISTDGNMGIGDPGGECKMCPFNQFESANQGKGKACKEMRNVFILTENALLPFVLQVPPTSIKPLKKYVTGLTRYGKNIYQIITKISLEKTKSSNGITYSLIHFEPGQVLSQEQVKTLNSYREAFVQAFDQAHATSVSNRPAFSDETPY